MAMNTLDGPRLSPASGGAARQLIILLHGYGSDGADLIGLAPSLQSILPDAAFVAPNAPMRCPGAGYQWWPLATFSMAERLAGVMSAAPALDAFIDAELAQFGLDDADLLLVGFSQGTMMALHVGVRRQKAVAGIIGFSGVLIAPERLTADARSRPPVLLVHGDADPVIPVQALESARAGLAAVGFAVESHVSPGLGHGIDPAGLALARGFARRVLARQA